MHKKQASNRDASLRVLCAESWFPSSVWDEFANQQQISIQLFTYRTPNEFLRQMANSDGKVDVICTSSWLLKSLVHSHWVKNIRSEEFRALEKVAVDFLHLPHDPQGEYSIPLFWDLYGFFGKRSASDISAAQLIQSKRVGVWADELSLFSLVTQVGVHIERREEQEDVKGLRDDMHSFVKSVTRFTSPQTQFNDPKDFLGGLEWTQAPLSMVAPWLKDPSYRFALPVEGGAMEIGLLAIGEKSTQTATAVKLINSLLSDEVALDLHQRLHVGVIQSTLNNAATIPEGLRPQALRQFPLTRLYFPNLGTEILPAFERVYLETVKPLVKVSSN